MDLRLLPREQAKRGFLPSASLVASFLSQLPTQQALLLLVGSLCFDVGGLLSLAGRRLLFPAAVIFIVASSFFVVRLPAHKSAGGLYDHQTLSHAVTCEAVVTDRSLQVGLGLDVAEIRVAARAAELLGGPLGEAVQARAWLRWAALALNVAGGAVTCLGSGAYLRASETDGDYAVYHDEYRQGNILSAIGIWLFCVGIVLIAVDVRATAAATAAAQGTSVVYDEPLLVLTSYAAALFLFGAGSTVYVLPGPTARCVGTWMLVVANTSFTLLNVVALAFLWREHAAEARSEERGDDEAPSLTTPLLGPEAGGDAAGEGRAEGVTGASLPYDPPPPPPPLAPFGSPVPAANRQRESPEEEERGEGASEGGTRDAQQHG